MRWAQLHERCVELIDAAGPGADAEALMRSVVGRRLRWGLSAAGYLDPKVFHFFERNGVALASGFGMTEGTGGITMTPPGRYVDNTQGPPLPGVRARLGEKGELQVSGAYIARYLEDAGPGDLIPYPESPEKDYWLATGDVFEKLENGYFRIVDRIKDIYKNNRGQTIAPLKVENKFTGVPGFLRTFLVGDGRPHNVLFIVPDRGDPVLGAGLRAENEREYYRRIVTAANADLPPYERVVNFALLDRDFDPARGEVTPKGSFNRKAVEKNFEPLVESLYRVNHVELESGGLRVRIPLWFYRDLGILEDDILFREDGLHDLSRRLSLPLRRGADPGPSGSGTSNIRFPAGPWISAFSPASPACGSGTPPSPASRPARRAGTPRSRAFGPGRPSPGRGTGSAHGWAGSRPGSPTDTCGPSIGSSPARSSPTAPPPRRPWRRSSGSSKSPSSAHPPSSGPGSKPCPGIPRSGSAAPRTASSSSMSPIPSTAKPFPRSSTPGSPSSTRTRSRSSPLRSWGKDGSTPSVRGCRPTGRTWNGRPERRRGSNSKGSSGCSPISAAIIRNITAASAPSSPPGPSTGRTRRSRGKPKRSWASS